MTWGEFKAAVEAAGVIDADVIYEINILAPARDCKLITVFGRDGTVQIMEDD